MTYSSIKVYCFSKKKKYQNINVYIYVYKFIYMYNILSRFKTNILIPKFYPKQKIQTPPPVATLSPFQSPLSQLSYWYYHSYGLTLYLLLHSSDIVPFPPHTLQSFRILSCCRRRSTICVRSQMVQIYLQPYSHSYSLAQGEFGSAFCKSA